MSKRLIRLCLQSADMDESYDTASIPSHLYKFLRLHQPLKVNFFITTHMSCIDLTIMIIKSMMSSKHTSVRFAAPSACYRWTIVKQFALTSTCHLHIVMLYLKIAELRECYRLLLHSREQ